MSDRHAIAAWLRGYADCLADAVPGLLEGQDPDGQWSDRCQEFDTTLRQFDVTLLREVFASAEGARLLARLDEAKARFEAAVEQRKATIEERLRDLGGSRVALKGYADAAAHQRMGAVYVEKAL